MEAFVAVGLASSVVQFLDFAVRLVSNTKELYSSLDSRTENHANLELVRSDLEKLAEGLKPRASTDPGLQQLVSKCAQVATELQEVLEKLKLKKGRYALWNACVSAFRNSWKEAELRELTSRLFCLRDELQFCLIVKLSGQIPSYGIDSELLRSAADNVQQLCQEQPNLVQNLDRVGEEIIRNVQSNEKALTDTERHLEGTLQRFHSETTARVDVILSNVEDLKKDLRDVKALPDGLDANTNLKRGEGSYSDYDVIQTFWYRGIDDRYNDVHDAHAKTFRWTLHRDERDINRLYELGSSFEKKRPSLDVGEHYSRLCAYAKQFTKQRQISTGIEWDPCRLKDWLRRGNDLFWVTGKPGSGKSTFMKYIREDPVFEDLLKEWAGPSMLLVPSFFFWRAGPEAQRSHLGLLLSLLYQVMKTHPQLIGHLVEQHEVQAAVCRRSSKLDKDAPCWTIHEAKRIFARLMMLKDTKTCLVIDGLDEFEGDPSAISDLLKTFARHDSTKILFSGRNLIQFQSIFHGYAPLFLHDWTRHDIETYATGRLCNNRHVKQAAVASEAEYEELIKQLLDKAEGVFLWVETAVSNLLDGFRNCDTLQELALRLDELPQELDDLYRTILLSLNERYLQQTRFFLSLFQVFHKRGGTIYWDHFAFAARYTGQNSHWIVEEYKLDRGWLQTTTHRRIESRCAQFLVFDNWGDIECMHKTFFDFLRSHSMQEWLNESEIEEEDLQVAMDMGRLMGWLTNKRYLGWLSRKGSGFEECFRPKIDLFMYGLSHIFYLQNPTSASASRVVEQIGQAIEEWYGRDSLFPFAQEERAMMHDRCKNKMPCREFSKVFFNLMWRKYWPTQRSTALISLWLYSGHQRLALKILQSMEGRLETSEILDLMTMVTIRDNVEKDSVYILGWLCSQYPEPIQPFWHRILQMVNCQLLCLNTDDEGRMFGIRDLGEHVEVLLSNAANAKALIRPMYTSMNDQLPKTALQILRGKLSQSHGIDSKRVRPYAESFTDTLSEAIQIIEKSIADDSHPVELDTWESEWELDWCQKECRDYWHSKLVDEEANLDQHSDA